MGQNNVSNMLKRKEELIILDIDANANSKRHMEIKYPIMEAAIADWFKCHKEREKVSGDLVCEATGKILNPLRRTRSIKFL